MGGFININIKEFKQLQELAEQAGVSAFEYKGEKFKTEHSKMIIECYERT